MPSGNKLDLILFYKSEVIGNLEVLSPLARCKHSPVVAEIFLDASCSHMHEAAQAKRPFNSVLLYYIHGCIHRST